MRLVSIRQRFLRRWRRRITARQSQRHRALLAAGIWLWFTTLLSLLMTIAALRLPLWSQSVNDSTRFLDWVTFFMEIPLLAASVIYFHPAFRRPTPGVVSAGERRHSKPSMTIFVMGVGHRSEPIVVNPGWKVVDILWALRSRHLIPHLSRVRPVVYFNPFSLRPLPETASLGSVGVQDLSTLYVRFRLAGGSSHTPSLSASLDIIQEDDLHIAATRRSRRQGQSSAWRHAHDAVLQELVSSGGMELDNPWQEGVSTSTSQPEGENPSTLRGLEPSPPINVELHSPASSMSGPSTRNDTIFLESSIRTHIRTHTLSGSLLFTQTPTASTPFTAVDISDVSESNDGPHSLVVGSMCNGAFLDQESWLLSVYHQVSSIASPGDTSMREELSAVFLLLRQEWARMQIHKQCEWLRQGKVGAASGRTGSAFIDTERHFHRLVHLSSPVAVVHHITALLLHVMYRLPRRATRVLLVALRALLRIARGGLGSDPWDESTFPIDIRTILGRLDLDPVTHSHICCPTCFTTRPRPFPQTCQGREAPDSKPCGASLWRTRTIRGRTMSFPIRTYLRQDMKEWLGRLLSRHGIEDLMDAALKQAVGPIPSLMSDIWDAPIFREFYMGDGTRFVDAPPDEGRYIFGLAVDGFNPFQNKQAKQKVTVTAIYLYCFNLPPHLRFLPENMLLVGVIPGPEKPSIDQINHFLQPLVDELLVFWHRGVFYSRTAKFPGGRLVRCALGPLVCDLPAARQTAGFGHHNAKYFCSVCKLPRDDMDTVADPDSWPKRTCDDHRRAAQEWKDCRTVGARKKMFQQTSVRWSALLDLPYWDPIRFTVIDSMHNHYLGLLKHHCRNIWGMDVAGDDADDTEPSPSELSDAEVAKGLQHLYSGTERQLQRCKLVVLQHLCSLVQVHVPKGSNKAQLVKLLFDWRTREGINMHVDGDRATPASTTTNTSGGDISLQNRRAGLRGDVAAAEKDLLSGLTQKSLYSKYNTSVFQQLCEKHSVVPSGKLKNDLIRSLLEWRGRPSLSRSLSPADLARTSRSTSAYLADTSELPSPVDLMEIDSDETIRSDDQTATPRQTSFGPAANFPAELREASAPTIPIQLTVDRPPEAQGSSAPGAVLGRSMMKRIQDHLRSTDLPTWVSPVPTNIGSTARGKLSADQWHIFCVIHLPIILVKLWSDSSEARRSMLDNYMDLVTEVAIGGLLEMSQEAIGVCKAASLRYLQMLQTLYPNTRITPNQHNSLHIPFFMHLYGPLHPIRTFSTERMNYLLQRQNTNMKFGDLEATFLRHSCRAANLRILLEDDQIRTDASDLLEAVEDIASEDRRGTRLRESRFLGIPQDGRVGPPEQITLRDECLASLIAYLNRRAGRERFVDVRNGHDNPDALQLTNKALDCPTLHWSGVSYRSDSTSPKDSNIIFRSQTPTSVRAGRIQQIFSLPIWDSRGLCSNDTYLFVRPLAELSEDDVEHDPYRRYQYVGGQLYYDRYLDGVVISREDVVSHFARTPIQVPQISSPCIHVLSLDKSVQFILHAAEGDATEMDLAEDVDDLGEEFGFELGDL